MTTITELARLAEAAQRQRANIGKGLWDNKAWTLWVEIAADPQTILGLVRELAESKAEITRLTTPPITIFTGEP